MSDLPGVFELRRAIERGEPILKIGMHTLTYEQVERRIPFLRGDQLAQAERWLAGELGSLQRARGIEPGARCECSSPDCRSCADRPAREALQLVGQERQCRRPAVRLMGIRTRVTRGRSLRDYYSGKGVPMCRGCSAYHEGRKP